MLVLALDTATPAVVFGVVEVEVATGVSANVVGPVESSWHALGSRAERSLASGNRHAETLGQLIPTVLADAGIGMPDVSAIVVGIGPGPFTGLRVGMMTAAALADALGLRVHGACTHDAIARMHAASTGSVRGADFVVVTDARRRECYWARYDALGTRVSGAHVERPADVLARPDWRPSGLVIGDPAFSEALQTQIVAAGPTGTGLVLAVEGPPAGRSQEPLKPLYLRRPDATPPSARKPVTPR